jgi:hypothetical protein
VLSLLLSPLLSLLLSPQVVAFLLLTLLAMTLRFTKQTGVTRVTLCFSLVSTHLHLWIHCACYLAGQDHTSAMRAGHTQVTFTLNPVKA